MGNCTSKSSARDAVAKPQKDEIKDGAFKYNKNSRQVVYVGEHSRDDNLTAKTIIGTKASASNPSEESTRVEVIPDNASKPSLSGEIREYLERENDARTTMVNNGKKTLKQSSFNTSNSNNIEKSASISDL